MKGSFIQHKGLPSLV